MKTIIFASNKSEMKQATSKIEGDLDAVKAKEIAARLRKKGFCRDEAIRLQQADKDNYFSVSKDGRVRELSLNTMYA